MLLTNTRHFDPLFGNGFFKQFPHEFFETSAYRGNEPNVRTNDQKDTFSVTATLPGFEKNDVNIEFKENALLLKGESRIERKEKSDYHLQERKSVKFERKVHIPYGIDVGKIDATFENGVLEITLPKLEAEKSQSIAIN